MRGLVTTSWLAEHLRQVSVVDASWSLPGSPFEAKVAEAFAASRIPGARFWDQDKWSDESASIAPHNIPTKPQFLEAARGLRPPVVVYDQFGIFSSPKLWFTLRYYGVAAAVLDGGLPAWVAAGYDLEYGPPTPPGSEVLAASVQGKQWRLGDVRGWLDDRREKKLVDARSKQRFDGAVPDPRGLRSGHIPGSLNLPFTDLLDPVPNPENLPGGRWRGAKLKSDEALCDLFSNIGVSRGDPVAVTCGSGMTAGHIALALHRIGTDDIALYDGSWTEYAQTEDLPVSTTP
ncbi:hypothetical protein CTAYLR_005109 [Chrysophaeum taylorii]|uniref:Rhodanese domain-containing protein n=1 Tax=Chrysophaeum taylorii TaxID=2483200 RepID=A0AAD7UFV2_9STRA|nr:hypothetical protein CTAYLR_005109 [Chrysophaeum taylorii]